MRAVVYSAREAWRSLVRGGRLSLISLGTILTAFFTLSAFLVVESHLREVAAGWAETGELSVFLDDGVDSGAREALAKEIAGHEAVADVQFVSKPDALARFSREFPDLNDVVSSLDENPFPASLEVRLRPEPRLAKAGDALVQTLKGKPGVSDVRYDRQWLANMTALGSGLRLAGLVAVLILIVSAALTMSAVIRLGLHARRDELEIMELVGAPYRFIRGPFMMEGAMLGGAGAALALMLLWVGLQAAKRTGLASLTSLYGTGEVGFLDARYTTMVLVGAVVVGALAGAIASHPGRWKGRFLGPSR
jgi:cell division transport system permease protein